MRTYLIVLGLLLSTGTQAQTTPPDWQFLIPSQYHGGEAPTHPGTGWLALTASGGVWRLEPTEVRAAQVADPVMDSDEGQATGILISSAHAGALALLRIPGLKPGKVDTPDMKFKHNPREMSLSGGSLKMSFKGVEHVIEPTQAGIFLTQGARRTRLPGLWPAGNSENDDSASLLWAGDLDGDGRIDLLFAYSGYNRAGACLYLSARAGRVNWWRRPPAMAALDADTLQWLILSAPS